MLCYNPQQCNSNITITVTQYIFPLPTKCFHCFFLTWLYINTYTNRNVYLTYMVHVQYSSSSTLCSWFLGKNLLKNNLFFEGQREATQVRISWINAVCYRLQCSVNPVISLNKYWKTYLSFNTNSRENMCINSMLYNNFLVFAYVFKKKQNKKNQFSYTFYVYFKPYRIIELLYFNIEIHE